MLYSLVYDDFFYVLPSVSPQFFYSCCPGTLKECNTDCNRAVVSPEKRHQIQVFIVSETEHYLIRDYKWISWILNTNIPAHLIEGLHKLNYLQIKKTLLWGTMQWLPLLCTQPIFPGGVFISCLLGFTVYPATTIAVAGYTVILLILHPATKFMSIVNIASCCFCYTMEIQVQNIVCIIIHSDGALYYN